jgi:hypothetical protein
MSGLGGIIRHSRDFIYYITLCFEELDVERRTNGGTRSAFKLFGLSIRGEAPKVSIDRVFPQLPLEFQEGEGVVDRNDGTFG